MIDIAHSERRDIAKAFFDKVTDGIEIDPRWKLRMFESGTPELPEEPTKEQADAWIDLAKLFGNEDFYKSMRVRAEDAAVTGLQYGTDPLDKSMLARIELMKQIRAAIHDGMAPDSERGQSIVELHLTDSALMRNEPDTEAFRERIRAMVRLQEPFRKFYQLLAILRERPDFNPPEAEWLQAALRYRLGVE